MAVIGNDQRTQVTDFTGDGVNSIVAADLSSRQPTQATDGGSTASGSGITIGSNYVLTAGHVVFDTDTGTARPAGRVTEGPDVASLDPRPTTALDLADINFQDSDIVYPDGYNTLSGVSSSSGTAFGRDIAMVQTSSALSTTPMGMVVYSDPTDATGVQMTTAGFPALIQSPNSVNAGTVVFTRANGDEITGARLAYQSSDNVTSAQADGVFRYGPQADTEAGQSGSGVWTMVDDGTGTMQPMVMGVHTLGGSSTNGGHLITPDGYTAITNAMESGSSNPSADASSLPINVLIGSDPSAFTAGSGNDDMDGSYRREFIRGENGDDTIFGGGADDRIHGGSGTDRAQFEGSFDEYDLTITDATDPDQPSLTLEHARGSQVSGTDTIQGVEFGIFDFEDADGDGVDDDGNTFFVPFQADRNDPTKLRDGPDVTYNENIDDGSGNSLGTFSADVPAFMFDGDIEYSLTLGGASSTIYNIAYIVDSSGSMGFSTTGSATRLSETQDAYTQLTDFLTQQGISQRANYAVVDFSSSATLYDSLDADAAKQRVNSLTDSGQTNFDAALTTAEDWFESISTQGATNIAFFLSDGDNTRGPGASDSLQLVKEGTPRETAVDVRAFGIGSGADLQALSTIDSNNAVQLQDPTDLFSAFQTSGFSRSVIDRIDVKLGGSVVDTIAAADLSDSGVGLTYDGALDGLTVTPSAQNAIDFDVVFNDGTPTATLSSEVTTGQNEVRTQSADGTTTVVNFSVNQAQYRQSANAESITANDLDNTITLTGGSTTVDAGDGDDTIVIEGGTNTVDGGAGIDTAQFNDTLANLGGISQAGSTIAVGSDNSFVDVEFFEFTDQRIESSTLTATPEALFASQGVSISESAAGSQPATVTIQLANAAGQDIEFSYQTRDGSATAGDDYAAASGTATIAAGDTSVDITADLSQDQAIEGAENFFLDVSVASGATFAGGATSATQEVQIDDDDAEISVASLGDNTVQEGGPGTGGTFALTLDRVGDSSGTDVVDWSVSGTGSNPAGPNDFTGNGLPSGQATFNPGETSTTIEIGINPDRFIESDETFEVSFASASGSADVNIAPQTGTIVDDDTPSDQSTIRADGSGDFNGDGTDDILWQNEANERVGQFQMNNGNPSWDFISRAGNGYEFTGTGDFNGDGTDDVLWTNPNNNRFGQFEMNNGNASWQPIGQSGPNDEAVGTGDFNGDGTDDILWINSVNGRIGQHEMSNGNGSWDFIGRSSGSFEFSGTGDFDADGTDDLFWYDSSAGSFGQHQMSNGNASWDALGTAGSNFVFAGTGDFNGDDADDLLWYNPDTGRVGFHDVSSGDSTWNAVSVAGSNYTVAGTGDYNGDGTDDVLWYNGQNGNVGQYVMVNGQATWQPVGQSGSDFMPLANQTDDSMTA